MKRRVAAVDTMLSQDEPLDEQEQQAVIREFEEMQLAQNRTFRAMFGAIALLAATFFAHAAYSQSIHPWEARYTGELRTVVQSRSVILILSLQAASLLLAALALLRRLPRKQQRERGCAPAGITTWALIAAAAAAAAAGAVYWAAALRRSVAKYGAELGAHWDLAWLPAAPLGYVMLCGYVVHSVTSTGREVEKLKRLAYNYKKV